MPKSLPRSLEARAGVSLRPYTTLRAGGPAEWFVGVANVEQFAQAAITAQREGLPTTMLGAGSNVLPADAGVSGLVIYNRARRVAVARSGEVLADTGCLLQDLFLKTAQMGLGGLEFTVGIPGTLGGALVSNAGAYRSNVSEFLTELEIVHEGARRWVEPAWMEFSYRDSILRRPNPPACAVLRVRMRLPRKVRKAIFDEAREYQRQRIARQPAPASAGSFFKNVNDLELAARLPGLPERFKTSGVVPAGYLIEAAGMKGHRLGGAMFGVLHANFILNVGGASATEIRELAELGKREVRRRCRAELEEEVLYLGNWRATA
ncbi:MAG: UDP-N-acetylmuramate dehydrogenase [Fimbriimonas ginsengisoli]|uniref:UDP-N-acetylenolpyruvoylglucosamine reductase n=1 Tax=Fimbriimonas ginsengisoli TaxID=1005039 RepID=A0A931LTH8_FIMGI|nr:UDP-N-acetylmuramate dehydrogenase [Fimbriimonas ginsengisoli]